MPLRLWIRTPCMGRCTRSNISWWSLSVTCGRSVVFSGYSRFFHLYNWPPRYSWTIVESGVEQNKPNHKSTTSFHENSYSKACYQFIKRKIISQLRSYDRYILNMLLPKIFLYNKKAILDLSQAHIHNCLDKFVVAVGQNVHISSHCLPLRITYSLKVFKQFKNGSYCLIKYIY
jgi:hypothetical protein